MHLATYAGVSVQHTEANPRGVLCMIRPAIMHLCAGMSTQGNLTDCCLLCTGNYEDQRMSLYDAAFLQLLVWSGIQRTCNSPCSSESNWSPTLSFVTARSSQNIPTILFGAYNHLRISLVIGLPHLGSIRASGSCRFAPCNWLFVCLCSLSINSERLG